MLDNHVFTTYIYNIYGRVYIYMEIYVDEADTNSKSDWANVTSFCSQTGARVRRYNKPRVLT